MLERLDSGLAVLEQAGDVQGNAYLAVGAERSGERQLFLDEPSGRIDVAETDQRARRLGGN
jgi:hypothetical protein